MCLCSCHKAEVFSSVPLQHHHGGPEGFECYRGADRGGRGRELHTVRVHECLSDHQRPRDPQAGPEIDQNGGEGKRDRASRGASVQPGRKRTYPPAGPVFEQVYLTAGAVYGLEGTLGDLEHCARSISSGTTDTELSFLEDQVATAAAQVQQSELQVRLRAPGLERIRPL